MKKIVINGGRELNGKILLQGSKNSALPILAATLAVDGVSVIHNCPDLTDVTAALKILEHTGNDLSVRANVIGYPLMGDF